jgi:hypothetical protein
LSIIQNAIDSIQIGIEDYESDDDRRSVSAVRNISAGVLLLYKEKLCQLSPADNKELLIKQNIQPVQDNDGEIIFDGKGNKTVDVQSIKERFRSLKVTVDWTRFDEINKLRNELEHYYTEMSPDAVREIVAKSFLLIKDFLSEYLDKDPQETLGSQSWSTLLEVSEVYTAEEKACNESIDAIEWIYDSVKYSLDHLRCDQCHSSLIQAPYHEDIYPNINLNCKSCNHDFSFDEIVEQCIHDSLTGAAFSAAKDGDRSPYDSCFECNKSTFILSEGRCVACGYQMEYTSCERCGEGLGLEDQYNEGKCGYCQYQWEKMLAE